MLPEYPSLYVSLWVFQISCLVIKFMYPSFYSGVLFSKLIVNQGCLSYFFQISKFCLLLERCYKNRLCILWKLYFFCQEFWGCVNLWGCNKNIRSTGFMPVFLSFDSEMHNIIIIQHFEQDLCIIWLCCFQTLSIHCRSIYFHWLCEC